MTQAIRKRVLTVTDAPDEVQAWVDQVVTFAIVGTNGDWPHSHANMPLTTITLGELLRRIAEAFAKDGVPWSVVKKGFPPVERTAEERAADPGPNQGSMYHNLLHSMLGNFH